MIRTNMDNTMNPLRHQDIQDLLGAYALGVADPAEQQAVVSHLAGCAECREEVAALGMAVHALPLGSNDRAPSPELRSRILLAAERTPQGVPNSAPEPRIVSMQAAPIPIGRSRRSSLLPWAVAAALLVFSVGMMSWNVTLRDANETAVRTIAALEATGPGIDATGNVTYLESSGVLLVSTDNLPPVAVGQVYQVWLIDGSTPISAGVLLPGSTTFAIVVDPSGYQVIAITIELGPIGVAAPTSEPILAGAIEA